MITCRTAYVASCKAKSEAAAKASAQFRVARQQKNGKLSASDYRFDLFATEAEALKAAAYRKGLNPGNTYVVVPA